MSKPFSRVFYTNWFIPTKFAGFTILFVVLIRPEYINDIGLLTHELVHVKQFWSTFGLMPILYLLSREYRLQYEVEAYRAQMACYIDDRSALFASFLTKNYRLKITQEQAKELLLKKE